MFKKYFFIYRRWHEERGESERRTGGERSERGGWGDPLKRDVEGKGIF